MTGSLHIKKDMYYMVLNTYENGKRKQKWLATGLPVKGNKRKADQMLRDTLHEYELNQGTVKDDVTLADYVRHWLTVAERKVDPVTYQGYETIAGLHVLPYFDTLGVKLQDVTLPILQAYFDEKAQNGRTDGKGGLSPKSLRLHKNVVHQTLEEAVKSGLLSANPSRFLALPKLRRYDAQFYNAEQIQALFHAIEGDPIAPLVHITVLYGLRRSEVLGLKWDSVDFERKTITIKHTVTRVTTTVAKDTTKTASSHRSFPLVPDAEKIFRTVYAEREENRRLLKRAYHDSEYIFVWPDGTSFSSDYVSQHFALLLKKHGLPHIRFHELRHSCASLLIDQGFNLKDIQEWMGHADIQTTANIYGHLDVARKQSMADKLANTLTGGC